MDAVDRAPQIHAQPPFPVLVGAGACWGLQADTGIVDQYLQGAKLLLDLIGDVLPAVAVHHVVLDGVHARIISGEELQRVADVLVVEVAKHDLHASFVEDAGDTKANAAGAACDVGDLALDVGDCWRLRRADVRRIGGCRIARNDTAQQAARARRRHAAKDLPPVQCLLIHIRPRIIVATLR